jgi:beta-glucosidase
VFQDFITLSVFFEFWYLTQVDQAVGAILYYKFKLGLFENPYRFLDTKREAENVFTAENRKIAKEAAEKSILLLKNSQQVLPVKNPNQKVALIGYYANSKSDMADMWKATADAQDCVTIFEGLKKQFSNLTFSEGYNKDNYTTEALINEAVKNAAAAELVIVNIGITSNLSGEDKSLANINIPEGQMQLLKALKKTGKPIVTLVSSGRPMILTEVQGLSDALVQCWVLGTETGNAIADVILGKYNPSAKTVMSFPYAIGQIPVYYNHFNTGRPAPEPNAKDKPADFYSRFHDIPNEPLYPFGYGLSYTAFEYSNISLSSKTLDTNNSLSVSVELKNTGKYDGEEVVQLYIQDITASIVRPVKELKGFKKVLLKAGEKTIVSFKISPNDFAFFDHEGKSIIEKGKFNVFVGGNSRDVLSSSFELVQ